VIRPTLVLNQPMIFSRKQPAEREAHGRIAEFQRGVPDQGVARENCKSHF